MGKPEECLLVHRQSFLSATGRHFFIKQFETENHRMGGKNVLIFYKCVSNGISHRSETGQKKNPTNTHSHLAFVFRRLFSSNGRHWKTIF